MAKATWNAEIEALIKRFRALPPPKESFELRSGVTVIDPELFYKALAGEIAGGPIGARARTGALKTDLVDYLAKLEGRSPEKKEDLPGKVEP